MATVFLPYEIVFFFINGNFVYYSLTWPETKTFIFHFLYGFFFKWFPVTNPESNKQTEIENDILDSFLPDLN